MTKQRLIAGAAALFALGLAGCGALSDDTAGRAMMAPGRFDFHPCPNIEAAILAARTRRTELEQLMARSEQSPGGALANALAYRTEYVQKGGELQELARAANDKKCTSESQWSSGRQLY
jgi:hypothetical protein